MAYTQPGSRFNEDNYHVYKISEHELVLTGGGDFYADKYGEPDHETWDEARKLAEKYGGATPSTPPNPARCRSSPGRANE